MASKNDERREQTGGQEPEAQTPAVKTQAKSAGAESSSGIWTYIGPNIKGAIHTGKTFRGTRAKVLEQARAALEAEPMVQRMIVAGETLARDRVLVRTQGTVLYETFKAIAKKEREKEATNA